MRYLVILSLLILCGCNNSKKIKYMNIDLQGVVDNNARISKVLDEQGIKIQELEVEILKLKTKEYINVSPQPKIK